MNSSAVSVYDNVNTPENLSKSSVYRTLNDLLNVNTDFEVRIYCPLCVKNFGFKFSLFEHLRTFHDSFLTQASDQTLRFTECPFCSAKFYGKHLTAKHVLKDHSKVVKGLFVNKNKFKCCFCNVKLAKVDLNSVVKHIEELHFLDFEEEFRKMFSCDTTQDMSISEFINSSIEENQESSNWEDVCMKVGNNSGRKLELDAENFDEASRINCYDFTELKQQLENIKRTTISGANSGNKSILKDVRNSQVRPKSARRVLRFDLPSDCEDKENVIPKQSFSDQTDLDEPELFSEDKLNSFLKINGTFCEEPQHSSTPNSRLTKPLKDEKKKNLKNYKSTFKSYITESKTNQFEFQCGKCSLLFKENLDLVSHVKNTHKKLGLDAFQPRYHCAICNARFYKNRYLRKHHNLHKPY